eukprot:371478_1
MSTIEHWISLQPCPTTHFLSAPTGIDKNNYIIIDHHFSKINCIHKYDINTDNWLKINVSNQLEVSTGFTSTFNAKKQVIHIFSNNCLTYLQLTNNTIRTENVSNSSYIVSVSKIILLNNSLFLISGFNNSMILEYNIQTKVLSKFAHMYNESELCAFGLIYSSNTNTLLTFGGYDCSLGRYGALMKYILQFDIQTKQWNKLPISLPYNMSRLHCILAIRNQYV